MKPLKNTINPYGSHMMTNPDPNVVVPEEPKLWEATELKSIVIEMLKDPKMIGLARYMSNIRIFWSRTIPTACAGHGFIFFNPDFYGNLPEETRKTVMAHEVWHLILRHLERGKKCDPYQHNIAADHVINNALAGDGFTFEGTKPYKDKKYAKMSTEQVYNAIYKKKPEDRPKPDLDAHISAEQIEDLVEDALADDGKGVSLDDQKKEAEKDMVEAGKQPGKTTGSVGINLEMSNQKIAIVGATYPEIFEKYLIEPLSGGKRTFMRPNRRQAGMAKNLRLPGRFVRRGHINRLTHLVYAFDVSGSMVSHAQQCHDSIRTLKDLLNPEKMTVLFFDTHIKEERVFTDKQPYGNMSVNAGGGTNLKHVYRRTEELDPEALVIFTDMCVEIPPEPKWDTLWFVTSKRDFIPPDLYGEVYLIPDHNK